MFTNNLISQISRILYNILITIDKLKETANFRIFSRFSKFNKIVKYLSSLSLAVCFSFLKSLQFKTRNFEIAEYQVIEISIKLIFTLCISFCSVRIS